MSQEPVTDDDLISSLRRPQFNLLALFVGITAIALYLAALFTFGRFLGLGHEETLMQALFNKVFRLPLFLVWMVGGVMVLNRWSKHPRVSKFALTGLAGLGATAVLRTFADLWLYARMRPGTQLAADNLWIYMIGREVTVSVLQAIWLWFLLAALLMCRDTVRRGE